MNIVPPFPYFAHKYRHFGQEVLKFKSNINMPISAYNVREPPEFLRRIKIGIEEHDGDLRF